jgi:hypothetical protein
MSSQIGERWGEAERGAFDAMMQGAAKTLPDISLSRRKVLPRVTQTHGEWRGVVQLDRAKGRVPPRRPIGIRKATKPKVGR